MTILDYPKSSVVLLSGGLDSTTMLADMRMKIHASSLKAITFVYGQRHAEREVLQAGMIADAYQVEHEVLQVQGVFTHSPLILAAGGAVPVGENPLRVGVAPTYVPRRNTVLLAIAACHAEQIGFDSVAYGAHLTDSNYPDCTPEFAVAFNRMLGAGSPLGAKVSLYAPFIWMDKVGIVRRAAGHRVPVSLTHSCYQGLDPACGICDTCQLRIKAFMQAGFIDPVEYEVDIDWGPCSEFPEDVHL